MNAFILAGNHGVYPDYALLWLLVPDFFYNMDHHWNNRILLVVSICIENICGCQNRLKHTFAFTFTTFSFFLLLLLRLFFSSLVFKAIQNYKNNLTTCGLRLFTKSKEHDTLHIHTQLIEKVCY